MKKVLIAIEEFARSTTQPLDMLAEAGFDVEINKSGDPLDYSESSKMYESADYVIAGLEPYPPEFFERFPNINAISRVGVGVDSIDLPSAAEHNVKVFITSDKPSVAVAELCVANMVSLMRATFEMSTDLKRGVWNPIQGRDLRGCTVGIIGLGSIGKEVVKRVSGFGSTLIGYGRTWDESFASEYGVRRRTIEEVFKEANAITIHLPLTPETEGVISKELINSVQPGSVVLNTSRAGVMDNRALADAVSDHTVYGAAVDVFDEERDPYPYGELDRVILTPHIGSHTLETRRAMEEMAVKNLLMYASLSDASDPVKTRETLSYIEKHSVK